MKYFIKESVNKPLICINTTKNWETDKKMNLKIHNKLHVLKYVLLYRFNGYHLYINSVNDAHYGTRKYSVLHITEKLK